jgi:hypothetical protein
MMSLENAASTIDYENKQGLDKKLVRSDSYDQMSNVSRQLRKQTKNGAQILPQTL